MNEEGRPLFYTQPNDYNWFRQDAGFSLLGSQDGDEAYTSSRFKRPVYYDYRVVLDYKNQPYT